MLRNLAVQKYGLHPVMAAVSFGFGNKFMAGVGDVTEAKILRLVFHDCAKYKDGTGGCDGYVVMKYKFCFQAFGGTFLPWVPVDTPVYNTTSIFLEVC